MLSEGTERNPRRGTKGKTIEERIGELEKWSAVIVIFLVFTTILGIFITQTTSHQIKEIVGNGHTSGLKEETINQVKEIYGEPVWKRECIEWEEVDYWNYAQNQVIEKGFFAFCVEDANKTYDICTQYIETATLTREVRE